MSEILKNPGGEEKEPTFNHSVHIEIPEELNPYATDISIQSSIDNAKYRFSMPKDSKIFANVPVTSSNLAKALLAGEHIEVSLPEQKPGDCISVGYIGYHRIQHLIVSISSLYTFTKDSGWHLATGTLQFPVTNGPKLTTS